MSNTINNQSQRLFEYIRDSGNYTQMREDLHRDLQQSKLNDEETSLAQDIIRQYRNPLELFTKIRDVYRKIPSHDHYDQLYNVFQRWYWSWVNRFDFNNPYLAYMTKDVMKVAA